VTSFSQDLKAELWGTPAYEPDTFFDAKFYKTESGEIEVRPEWSFSKFIEMRNQGVKPSGSPGVADYLSELAA